MHYESDGKMHYEPDGHGRVSSYAALAWCFTDNITWIKRALEWRNTG